jgi:hypothetical protein
MNIIRATLAAWLFALATAGFAQVFYPPFDVAFSDPLTVLRVSDIQKELQIGPEQNAKLKAALAPLVKKYDEKVKALQALPVEESKKQYAEFREAVLKEGLGIAEARLKPEQWKRFKQIQLQRRKHEAFTQPDVQKALMLTDQQKQDIREVLDERDRKWKSLKAFTFKDRERLAEEALQAILAKLSPEQLKAWAELTGPPFKLNEFGMLQRLN